MNRAKGTNGRGGKANAKKYEGRRHGGGRKGRWARSASRVEKAHETVERRNAQREIKMLMAGLWALGWE